MKKLVLVVPLLLFVGVSAFAASPIKEEPISNVVDKNGTLKAGAVSVSTSTWTLVPSAASGNIEKRSGIFLTNPGTNTGNMGIVLTNTATTPTISTTTYTVKIDKGNPTVSLLVNETIYVWAISLHTSAENLNYQEFRQ